MPRTGPGGNRTDLIAPAAQPIRVAQDQPYGEAGQQRDSERVVPLPASPTAAPTDITPTLRMLTPSRGVPAPGSLPFLGPTDRPNEPVTAGLPFGAGAGPEAMGIPSLVAPPAASTFKGLAQSPNATPEVRAAAEAAALLGL